MVATVKSYETELMSLQVVAGAIVLDFLIIQILNRIVLWF